MTMSGGTSACDAPLVVSGEGVHVPCVPRFRRPFIKQTVDKGLDEMTNVAWGNLNF